MKQEIMNEFVEDDGVGDFLADISEDDWKLEQRGNGEGGSASLAVELRVAGLVQDVLRTGVQFDYADVLVEGVESVLESCGLRPVLSCEESELLRVQLMALGGANQTREMSRMVSEKGEPGLRDVPERNWSIKAERSFREVFLASLRARRARECERVRRDVTVAERLGLRNWRDVMPSAIEGVPVGVVGT